ncbi:hypothetical protein CURTO8I2_140017 [Curtobacterium sp. 8I-2]|nr:hypothetical protein CURTO8I2_140017 [Curtobacterium sp. 8I-2]
MAVARARHPHRAGRVRRGDRHHPAFEPARHDRGVRGRLRGRRRPLARPPAVRPDAAGLLTRPADGQEARCGTAPRLSPPARPDRRWRGAPEPAAWALAVVWFSTGPLPRSSPPARVDSMVGYQPSRVRKQLLCRSRSS